MDIYHVGDVPNMFLTRNIVSILSINELLTYFENKDNILIYNVKLWKLHNIMCIRGYYVNLHLDLHLIIYVYILGTYIIFFITLKYDKTGTIQNPWSGGRLFQYWKFS